MLTTHTLLPFKGSRDVKVERQHRRSSLNPDASAIKRGLKAAFELQEERAMKGELHDHGDNEGLKFSKVECDQYDDYMKLAEAKRKGLAANVLEDALFVGGAGLFESASDFSFVSFVTSVDGEEEILSSTDSFTPLIAHICAAVARASCL